jgi:hypothetical protein
LAKNISRAQSFTLAVSASRYPRQALNLYERAAHFSSLKIFGHLLIVAQTDCNAHCGSPSATTWSFARSPCLSLAPGGPDY